MNYSDFEWKLCNRVFTDARVSYPDCQEVYSSYEEAYEKIKTHGRN